MEEGVATHGRAVHAKAKTWYTGYTFPSKTFTRARPRSSLSLAMLSAPSARAKVARTALYGHVTFATVVVSRSRYARWAL